MDLSSYYDADGDLVMDEPTVGNEPHHQRSIPRGVEERKSAPPSHPDKPRYVEVSGSSEPDEPPIDYREMRIEARRKRYPSYFKGRSDPADERDKARDLRAKEGEDAECFFVPERLSAKPKVDMASRLTIKMDKGMKQIIAALVEDNGKVFAGFLKNPATARKAIHRLCRMKLPSFHQVRLLTLWHLLRKSHADNVGVAEAERESVADYLAEVHEVLDFSFLAQTRKRLLTCLDEPSWLWLDFFKRLWTPEMGHDLQAQVRAIGPRRVKDGVTPLIQAYHTANRPFRTFASSSRSAFPSGGKDRETEIEIPSMWFRSIFYPLLGGEPQGLFDDTPMSFKDTLATMIS